MRPRTTFFVTDLYAALTWLLATSGSVPAVTCSAMAALTRDLSASSAS
jgi:hypothetical protein